MSDKLKSPIAYLKGVGPVKAEVLQKELGIFTFGHLLLHFPFRYIDLSKIYSTEELHAELPFVQLVGKLGTLQEIGSGRGKRLSASFRDATGEVELVWFQGQKWVKQSLRPGGRYRVMGKPNAFGRKISLAHPELEFLPDGKTTDTLQGLRPVYSTTEKLKKKGLDSRQLTKLIHECLTQCLPEIGEILPANLLGQHKLLSRRSAFQHIHFPESMQMQKQASYRLKFEELLLLQIKLLRTSLHRKKHLPGFAMGKVGAQFNAFFHEHLPFTLTNAQKRVTKEIHHDMRTGKQMNRLLQGDVGAGKTLVALLSMLLAIDNHTQALLMAPTEILAQQHYQSIQKMLDPLPVRVELLTGSTSQAERRNIHEGLQNGNVHILIGTHALIEDTVKFKALGLAVIDEQHRFGVAQRAKLWKKGEKAPHILVMTATPIPRTLAMTVYGDLDTSVLDELPPGRKAIETRHYFEKNRLKVFGFIKQEIAKGRQVYMVYPLIEESDKLDLQNLMQGYEAVCRAFPKPHYQVSVVHGKMKAEDKEAEMQRFKRGETHIMVATTVIEVGVDVPNASVVLIENAERFGLSQLHQLRGRVGRGAAQSYCLLLTSYKLSADARKRMATMVETNDGFKIAEVDLEIRGPGDVGGTQQSGIPQLKLANLVQDQDILAMARKAAKAILRVDPALSQGENAIIKRLTERNAHNQVEWNLIS